MCMTPSPETLDFIRLHRTDDVQALALHAARHPGIDFPFALKQIAGWQASRHKLPRWSATEGILYPVHLSMEQCSSETTAACKADVMGTGERAVDLTGGFGVDCSFLARKYRHVDYVERNPELCALARHNFPLLGCTNVEVHEAEAEDYLRTMEPADMVYLDPARRDSHGGRTVAIADCTPDVTRLLPLLLEKSPAVCVKLSPMLDIAQALRDLPSVGQVFVISVQGECKELLLLLSRVSGQSEHAVFHCLNLTPGTASRFSFTADEERSAECKLTSTLRAYLYEPGASLLKAGAFRLPAARYGMEKLHPNSHLYTSDTCQPDFPGRMFAVESVCGFSKQELKALTASAPQANLTVRNFPASVAELRKRLRLREGGDIYLFATTLADGRKVIVKCKKAPNYSIQTDRQ